MIIFQNPGLIDLDAIKIVGISAKLPDSIGRFGTGIKYAFATILRNGGAITVYRGMDKIVIGTRTKQIRGQDFNIVTMNRKDTGFATHMGRDWKPWMVLRELASNAMDEGGIYRDAEAFDASIETSAEQTTIVVDWEDLELAYRNRSELFIEGDKLIENSDLIVYDKPVRYIYYRGIRAHELPNGTTTAFAYDLRSYQTLTEDRTLLWPDQAKSYIAKAFLRCEDEAILRKALYGNNGYEGDLDYEQHDEKYQQIQPTRAFIDMCIEAREAGKLHSNSARKLLMEFLREQESGRVTPGRMNSHPVVEWLVDSVERLGFTFDDEKMKIVITPELPGVATTLFEKGRIYILASALESGQPRIELLKSFMTRLVEAQTPYPTFERGLEILLPMLIKTNHRLNEMMVEEANDAAQQDEEEPVF